MAPNFPDINIIAYFAGKSATKIKKFRTLTPVFRILFHCPIWRHPTSSRLGGVVSWPQPPYRKGRTEWTSSAVKSGRIMIGWSSQQTSSKHSLAVRLTAAKTSRWTWTCWPSPVRMRRSAKRPSLSRDLKASAKTEFRSWKLVSAILEYQKFIRECSNILIENSIECFVFVFA